MILLSYDFINIFKIIKFEITQINQITSPKISFCQSYKDIIFIPKNLNLLPFSIQSSQLNYTRITMYTTNNNYVYHNNNNKQSRIQQQQLIRLQNENLSRLIETYLQQIQKQKQINQQHQNQIQSLLKFNQRLLHIIETEIAANRKQNGSLLPISEKSERQSDLMNPINSLIKTRKTIIAKSQIGAKSVNDNTSLYQARLENFGKNLEHSQFVRSQDQDESFMFSVQGKSHYRHKNAQNQRKYSELSTKIQKQITQQIKIFKNCSDKNQQFYQSKINKLKELGNKLQVYKPEQNFNQIAKKVDLSPEIANLVKNAMLKGSRKGQ